MTTAATHRRHRGLTLLECTLALAGAALLSGIAFPSFRQAVHQGRRADAFVALARAQQAQERFRADAAAYARWFGPGGLDNASAVSPEGRYRIEIAQADATSYTLTAHAVDGQSADVACRQLRLIMDGHAGAVRYGSSADGAAWAADGADRCWPR